MKRTYLFEICQHCNRITGDTIMSGRTYLAIGDENQRFWDWSSNRHKCIEHGSTKDSKFLDYHKIMKVLRFTINDND